MQLGLSERSVVALNFLLIAACAYFAALSVDRIIAAHLLVLPTPSAALQSGPPTAALTRSAYELIVQRDIFDPYKPPPPPAAPAPVSLDLHLTLLGTSLLTKSKPYAIVEDQNTHVQNVYRLDEEIPDAGRLIKVEKTRVLIDHGGQVVALEVPSNGLPAAPSLAARMPRFAHIFPRNANDVHPVGRNQFVIDRSAVQRNLQNLGQVFTEMRALPNLSNGQTDGFRLSEIQGGSIFQQMGLQNGDVVTAVNGQALNDPTQAIALFNTLRNSNSINLTVMRGGQTMELNYDIR